MEHPGGKGARNTDEPQWAADMYRVFVDNLKVKIVAFAEVEQALAAAESDCEAAASAPAMAEPGRANLACAVHYAMEKRLALNDAMRNILFEIEMMTVHHLVKHEEELVILNHAQKDLVRSLHAAQAAFFWMQAQGTSRRVLTMSASASSRAPGQTQSALRTGQGVRGVRAWPGRSHPRQRRGSPRRGPVRPRSQVRAMGPRLRRGYLRSGHQVSPRSQTKNKKKDSQEKVRVMEATRSHGRARLRSIGRNFVSCWS